MAASANPSGNHHQEGSTHHGTSSSSFNGVTNNNGASSGGPPATETQAALRHNPGLSVDWTADEQSTLDDLLTKYASESKIVRYAKVALQLKDKTVRDVALRCRWMTKKENGKRRKEDNNSARKNKDKKEKVPDSSAKSSSHMTNRSNGTPYVPPMIPMDNDDGISYKDIGGLAGQFLEENAQAFNQISANFAAFQIHDNVNLFHKTRDNILRILNNFNDMPEIMKQMPPLPVKLNEDLANSILPRLSLQKKS